MIHLLNNFYDKNKDESISFSNETKSSTLSGVKEQIRKISSNLNKTKKEIKEGLDRIKDTQNMVYLGFLILLVMVGTLIFMGIIVLIESFRFNSATYKEYSGKIHTQNLIIDVNKEELKLIQSIEDLINRIE